MAARAGGAEERHVSEELSLRQVLLARQPEDPLAEGFRDLAWNINSGEQSLDAVDFWKWSTTLALEALAPEVSVA